MQKEVIITEEAPIKETISDEHPVKEYHRKKAIFRIYQVIWYLLGLIETLLVFRFLFRALGANSNNPFVDLIYSTTRPLIMPFQGIFPTFVERSDVIEWSTVIAMIIYAIVATGLVQLLQLIKPVDSQEVERKVDEV